MKDKKGTTITNPFQNILKKSNRHEAKSKRRRPSKVWVDKDSEIYNRLMKSWLEKNDIEMYLTHNGRKFVVSEIFIRTLKNQIYKYMISILNVYIYKLDDVVNKYNNTYHSAIKMKPVGEKSNTYIDSSKEINYKTLNLKSMILLEYQNIKTFLQKAMFQIFVIKKLKNTVPPMLLVILKAKKLLERFTKKNYKKQIKKSLKIKR